MEGIEVIAAALAAGASTGTTEVAGSAVRDAYDGLKHAVARRMAAHGQQHDRLLNASAPQAGGWRAELIQALIDSGAATDQELSAAARRVLELTSTNGGGDSNVVDASSARGVQIGNRNYQTNNFG